MGAKEKDKRMAAVVRAIKNTTDGLEYAMSHVPSSDLFRGKCEVTLAAARAAIIRAEKPEGAA